MNELTGQETRKRRSTQKVINFPAHANEIDRSLLTPLDPHGTEDSDNEESKSSKPLVSQAEEESKGPAGFVAAMALSN